ncbi:hypothetical protein DXG01_017210 [Tephrocybe rancida]|nr:hypothetical protein DXG01_017210 [Tephrocybe rancida]
MSSSSSTSSSRSASPTLSVSSGGLYIPIHKRTSGSSIASSSSSRTFSSGSSRTFSSRTSESSDSDSAIAPPTAPAFIYSRDTLLNLANSPLARLPQPQRDALRGDVPEVITNRKQRKAIEYHNQIHAVQTAALLRAPSPARSEHKRKHNKERAPKTIAV